MTTSTRPTAEELLAEIRALIDAREGVQVENLVELVYRWRDDKPVRGTGRLPNEKQRRCRGYWHGLRWEGGPSTFPNDFHEYSPAWRGGFTLAVERREREKGQTKFGRID